MAKEKKQDEIVETQASASEAPQKVPEKKSGEASVSVESQKKIEEVQQPESQKEKQLDESKTGKENSGKEKEAIQQPKNDSQKPDEKMENISSEKGDKKAKKEKRKKSKDFTPSDLEDLTEKLDKKDQSIFNSLTTKRFTRKISRDIIYTRLVTVSMILITLIVSVLYFLSYTYINSGYGIGIVTSQAQEKTISLSDNANFEQMTVGLRARAIDQMDNISFDWLPKDLDDYNGGSHNGTNYIAYTFYVINSGTQYLDYNSILSIKSATLNVETAIRVMVYRNGVPTVYTYSYETPIDGYIEQQGITVEQFRSDDTVTFTTRPLDIGYYDKYTVVVWLEGEDADCVDDKRSGELQLFWQFNVIES